MANSSSPTNHKYGHPLSFDIRSRKDPFVSTEQLPRSDSEVVDLVIVIFAKRPPSPPLDVVSETDTVDEGITGFVDKIEAGGDMDNFVGVSR